jgi:hypothetical protein
VKNDRVRPAIVIPAADTLGPMRRLGNDLAGARGALNVGLVVTVTPSHLIDIRAKKDGTAVRPTVPGETLEVEMPLIRGQMLASQIGNTLDPSVRRALAKGPETKIACYVKSVRCFLNKSPVPRI